MNCIVGGAKPQQAGGLLARTTHVHWRVPWGRQQTVAAAAMACPAAAAEAAAEPVSTGTGMPASGRGSSRAHQHKGAVVSYYDPAGWVCSEQQRARDALQHRRWTGHHAVAAPAAPLPTVCSSLLCREAAACKRATPQTHSSARQNTPKNYYPVNCLTTLHRTCPRDQCRPRPTPGSLPLRPAAPRPRRHRSSLQSSPSSHCSAMNTEKQFSF